MRPVSAASAAVLACLSAFLPGPAAAHEVRPAVLEVAARPEGTFDVTWKQPARAETALRLVPRLSNGWLDGEPSKVEVGAGFVLKVWGARSAGANGLEGVSASVEGLDASLTDVLLTVSPGDGSRREAILKPGRSEAPLLPAEPPSLPVPAYFRLGVEHILAGLDHLLFVLGLVLLVRSRWKLVQTVTAFTAAHSITLAAASLGWMAPDSATVEALVALSIVFLAVEVVRGYRGETGVTARFPWLVSLAFGLLHGMAFAGALAEIGLPKQAIASSLFLFNLGVEAGQLLFVGAVLGIAWLDARLFGRFPRWARLVPPYGIGSLAVFWFFQRAAAVFH